MLGDPTSPDDPGSPTNWVAGGPDSIPDVLVILAADTEPARDTLRDRMAKEASHAGRPLRQRPSGGELLDRQIGRAHV